MSENRGVKLKPVSIQRGENVLPFMIKMRDEREIKKELKNFLKGLPSMIKQNGLGQTIAFLMSKDDEGYRTIADIMAKVLIGGRDKSSKDLMQEILNSDVKQYTIMQKEAIEYAGWIKRFALAFYKEEADAPATSA